MRLFGPLYDWVMHGARHRHAPWYLGGLSVAESSVFPIPPDVMLIPMTLARPERGLNLALLTTACSVVGGLLGYLLGFLAFDLVEPWLISAGYGESFATVRDWYQRWGAWAVLVAGFSPIPYKVFTIASGLMALSLLPFLLASVVGRGARFLLVAQLVRWGGPAIEPYLRRYVEAVGWAVVAVAVLLYLVYLR